MNFSQKKSFTIEDLREIMRLLRGDNGCPWDKEQTHQSIRKNFIEETYEVCEAIDQNDPSMLREELGDVLLQVIFHTQMEEEQASFTFEDVVTELCQKLVIRHPHVFADWSVSGSSEVLENWNKIKQETKGQTTATQTLCSVPKQLPALMRSQKVLGRAKKANPAFGATPILNTLQNEVAELCEALTRNNRKQIGDLLGDSLFAAVNLAHFLGYDAEELLTGSCDQFVRLFSMAEQLGREQGIDVRAARAEELEMLWNQAKEQEV